MSEELVIDVTFTPDELRLLLDAAKIEGIDVRTLMMRALADHFAGD